MSAAARQELTPEGGREHPDPLDEKEAELAACREERDDYAARYALMVVEAQKVNRAWKEASDDVDCCWIGDESCPIHGRLDTNEPRVTHGRHCPCSACRLQDWTKIKACGMHPDVSAYLHFDGMTWPNPADPTEVEYRLRHGGATREDLLVAASVFAAYKQLAANGRRELVAALRAAGSGKGTA